MRAYRTSRRQHRHVSRVSRTSIRYGVFMFGAGMVALFSMAFAWLAELALHWNAVATRATPGCRSSCCRSGWQRCAG